MDHHFRALFLNHTLSISTSCIYTYTNKRHTHTPKTYTHIHIHTCKAHRHITTHVPWSLEAQSLRIKGTVHAGKYVYSNQEGLGHWLQQAKSRFHQTTTTLKNDGWKSHVTAGDDVLIAYRAASSEHQCARFTEKHWKTVKTWWCSQFSPLSLKKNLVSQSVPGTLDLSLEDCRKTGKLWEAAVFSGELSLQLTPFGGNKTQIEGSTESIVLAHDNATHLCCHRPHCLQLTNPSRYIIGFLHFPCTYVVLQIYTTAIAIAALHAEVEAGKEIDWELERHYSKKIRRAEQDEMATTTQ